MDDGFQCADCQSSHFDMIVHYGSYIVACRDCHHGPATSFLAVAPLLEGTYHAVIINDDWVHTDQKWQGEGSAFIDSVRTAAQSGKRVLIQPATPADKGLN